MENNCKRLAGVKEFNIAFKHPVFEVPVKVIDVEYIKKRVEFIQEELRELVEAAEANDIVGVTDALLDIDYFNLGTVFGMGVEREFVDGFQMVQDCNMSKLCEEGKELNDTLDMYSKQGLKVYAKNVLPNKCAVYNSETGKVMKSISYVAPDLKKVFTTVTEF